MIKYSLFHPSINKELILKELDSVLSSKFIGQGPKSDEFEKQFESWLNDYYPAYTNNKVVCVNSGTSALHLSYILAGIKEGDEVITPVLTCTATTHAILYQKAIPVFADIQLDTLNIDPTDIEKKITKKTKAIIVMHNGGMPCDMDKIMEIAKENGLMVIEDSAQAIGGEYNGNKLGTIGDFGTYSFQAIKTFSIGDGGALIINTNEEDYDRAKKLRWFSIDRLAKIKANWQPFNQRAMTYDTEEVGFKMQITDIDAAIGIAQLTDLNKNLSTRREYAKIYREELKNISGITLLRECEGNANWLFQILVNNRENFQKVMGKNGIETNMVQVRNDIYSAFKQYMNICPNMDEVQNKYVSLPLHPNLTKQDVYNICKIIKNHYAKN